MHVYVPVSVCVCIVCECECVHGCVVYVCGVWCARVSVCMAVWCTCVVYVCGVYVVCECLGE